MSIAWEWSSFWGTLKAMPEVTLRAVGHELNGDEFVNWIGSRSPKVQTEILESAPEPIQRYLYSRNVISPFAIMALGIQSSARVIDRRTK